MLVNYKLLKKMIKKVAMATKGEGQKGMGKVWERRSCSYDRNIP